MNERVTRIAFLIVLTLVVLRVLTMLLQTGGAVFHAAVIVFAYVIVPLTFVFVLLRPSWLPWMLLLAHIFDIQLVMGMASMKALFPLMVLCMAARIVSSTVDRKPLVPREVLHPGLLLCIGISVAVYLRDPQLPTLGGGAGSGFARYAQYFSSFLPLVLLPWATQRSGLRRIPVWIAGCSAAAALTHSILIRFAPLGIQLLFLTREHIGYFMQGRYSYLRTPASFLFLSGLSIWAFGNRRTNRSRLWAITVTIAGGFGLLLTGTRTLVLGAAASVLYVLIVKRMRAGVFVMGVVLVLLVFIRINIPRVETPFVGMIVRSVSFTMSDDTVRQSNAMAFHESETLSWRVDLWRHALDSIKRYPWMGRGFSGQLWGGSTVGFMTHAQWALFHMDSNLDVGSTHLLWLGVFVSFGIPAGIGFLAFAILRVWRFWRVARRIAPDHDLYGVTHFLGVWLAMIMGVSFSSGGTVMTEPLLCFGLLIVLDRYIGEKTVDKASDALPSDVSVQGQPAQN